MVCAGLVGLSVGAQAPMFFPDDPIREDHDTMFDAGAAQPIPPSQYYDFIENTFSDAW